MSSRCTVPCRRSLRFSSGARYPPPPPVHHCGLGCCATESTDMADCVKDATQISSGAGGGVAPRAVVSAGNRRMHAKEGDEPVQLYLDRGTSLATAAVGRGDSIWTHTHDRFSLLLLRHPHSQPPSPLAVSLRLRSLPPRPLPPPCAPHTHSGQTASKTVGRAELTHATNPPSSSYIICISLLPPSPPLPLHNRVCPLLKPFLAVAHDRARVCVKPTCRHPFLRTSALRPG